MLQSAVRPPYLLFLVFLVFLVAAGPAHAQSEEEAVLAVAQQVFDGINTRNGDLIREAMLPEGVIVSTVTRNGVPMVRTETAAQMASQVESTERDFHERMFETSVQIQDGVALVWATYDFHVDGAFSHCGVDTFSLVKTAEGWKVASLTYTVQMEGCGERPPIPPSDQ